VWSTWTYSKWAAGNVKSPSRWPCVGRPLSCDRADSLLPAFGIHYGSLALRKAGKSFSFCLFVSLIQVVHKFEYLPLQWCWDLQPSVYARHVTVELDSVAGDEMSSSRGAEFLCTNIHRLLSRPGLEQVYHALLVLWWPWCGACKQHIILATYVVNIRRELGDVTQWQICHGEHLSFFCLNMKIFGSWSAKVIEWLAFSMWMKCFTASQIVRNCRLAPIECCPIQKL